MNEIAFEVESELQNFPGKAKRSGGSCLSTLPCEDKRYYNICAIITREGLNDLLQVSRFLCPQTIRHTLYPKVRSNYSILARGLKIHES